MTTRCASDVPARTTRHRKWLTPWCGWSTKRCAVPLFERLDGLAARDVTIADPAVGTGTFLLGVLRKIARTVGDDLGPGSVPGALEDAAGRLIGFELQFGPFAVAQLRLLAEYGELMEEAGAEGTPPTLKLFITDTLGNPFVEEEYIPAMMQPVAQSRRAANQIKKTERITVVIGNPPYKEKAEGRGSWIESGSAGRQAPMERWRPPAALARRRARQAPQEPLCLFLALGDSQGLWRRLERRDGPCRIPMRKASSASSRSRVSSMGLVSRRCEPTLGRAARTSG